MRVWFGRAAVWAGLAVAFGPGGLVAQDIQLGDGSLFSKPAHRQYVELTTDAVQVKAGRPEWVELRFRVDPGMHINSHSPKDELLVATALEIAAGGAPKVVAQEYPAGIPLRLDVGGGEVLSTYQGEFRVRLQVIAASGESSLAGTLRYQACDARSCFPPKSLPVRVTLTAR